MLQELVCDNERADCGELLSDSKLLRFAAPLFTSVWVGDVLHDVLHPPVLELRNRDGDQIVWTIVHYPLAAGATGDQHDVRSVKMTKGIMPQEGGNLGEHRIVVANIAVFREPFAQLHRLSIWRNDDADSDFGGTSIVGAIEGNGADREAPKSRFRLLVQPLPRLPAQLG
jgi:hypothetical protein